MFDTVKRHALSSSGLPLGLAAAVQYARWAAAHAARADTLGTCIRQGQKMVRATLCKAIGLFLGWTFSTTLLCDVAALQQL